MITIKNQNFGVEIEMTGITRLEAAAVIAKYYGTSSNYLGTYYHTYGATDKKGRTWKAMSDGSIRVQKKVRGHLMSASSDYSCEVVTPILQYDDIEDLQEIIRALVKAGAIVNESCGIHVHVDGANHNVNSLTRLINFAVSRQDLFYEALQIGDRADRWCKKINNTLLDAMKNDAIKTRESMEKIWYSEANDGYRGGIDHSHYNSTRYHGINLHAFFTKGTVEFRLFNGTLHAGKIKAYIQFCLGLSAWAITSGDNIKFIGLDNARYQDKEARGKLMLAVLTYRLGLKGKEFKTARFHLTSAFGISSEHVAA